MSFAAELSDLFPDTVQVTVRSAPDEEGNTTLVSVRDLPARVIGKIKTAKDAGGNERMSSVQALFPGVYGLTVDMEYLLPPRFVPRNPKAISVGHGTDEDGAHHERVYFYWTQVG
jgi:hypothetical protein